MTVPVPEAEAPKEVGDIIAALTSMQATTGWAVIVKILNENIAYLENAIIEKIDPVSKEKLTEKETDLFRKMRGLNLDLLNTPKNYIQVLKDTSEVPIEYDPYFKTKKEIDDAKLTPQADDKGK